MMDLNWIAILVSVIVGQVFLTLWFAVFFGVPSARAYGVEDKATHTAEIPGYTYAIGLLCTFAVTIGLALLQSRIGVTTVMEGLYLGVVIGICFGVASYLPCKRSILTI